MRLFKTARLRHTTPCEIALAKLEAARPLMILDETYTFVCVIEETVRHYVEEHFHARAAHRTTEEFLHDLLTAEYLSLVAYRPVLADFVEHCDLARGAHWQLSLPEMEAMHLSACAFVIETGQPLPSPSERQSVN